MADKVKKKPAKMGTTREDRLRRAGCGCLGLEDELPEVEVPPMFPEVDGTVSKGLGYPMPSVIKIVSKETNSYHVANC